jgi:hypothetical protein
MWRVTETARVGQFILVETDGGWNFDLFSTLTRTEVTDRLREYMRGWVLADLQMERGLGGVGSVLRVYGRVVGEPMLTTQAVGQVTAALNSFWTVGGASASGYVSDTLTVKETPGDVWGQRLDTALIVLGVLAVAWIIFNIRKGIE